MTWYEQVILWVVFWYCLSDLLTRFCNWIHTGSWTNHWRGE